MRFTPEGKAQISFSVALYTGKDKERAEWVECLQKMRRAGVTDGMMRQAVEVRSITQPIQMLAVCSKMMQNIES